MAGVLTEIEARRVVSAAVEELGGARVIVGSPRHPFGLHGTEMVEVEEHTVTVQYGEMSSPAIAMVEGWTFEIKETGLVVLDRPRQ